MEFNTDFFENYLRDAPLPLALERTLECHILSKKTFTRPILDIGCGEGLFAKKLFKQKIDVGIDPNPRELERAKNYDIYTELLQCKGDSIPKEDGSFNTILSNSVMEHIPEIDMVLKEAHRLLSNSGFIYLTLPTARFDQYTLLHQFIKKFKLSSSSKRYSQFFNKFWAHYHYYNIGEWTAKFESLGFKVVEAQEYGSKSTCILNSFAAPFSIIPFVTKKMTNRWFIFEGLRKYSAKYLNFLFNPFTKEHTINEGEGGLVFFSLQKKNQAGL